MIFDDIPLIDLVGFVGGLLYPLSIIPQIYKYHKTKDMSSSSLSYQLILILALICSINYSVNYRLYPILIPTIFELVLMLIMAMMKIQSVLKRKERVLPIGIEA